MPWPAEDYLKYKAWFDREYSSLKLPKDCHEIFKPNVNRAHQFSLIWTLEWALSFDDRRYVRVQEHYDKVHGLIGVSKRQGFAFHYGPLTGTLGAGSLNRDSTDPVDIRIDTSHGPVHMHFGKAEPHLGQQKVKGLDMGKLDLFSFVRGILTHRKTGKTLDKVFGFEII